MNVFRVKKKDDFLLAGKYRLRICGSNGRFWLSSPGMVTEHLTVCDGHIAQLTTRDGELYLQSTSPLEYLLSPVSIRVELGEKIAIPGTDCKFCITPRMEPIILEGGALRVELDGPFLTLWRYDDRYPVRISKDD